MQLKKTLNFALTERTQGQFGPKLELGQLLLNEQIGKTEIFVKKLKIIGKKLGIFPQNFTWGQPSAAKW